MTILFEDDANRGGGVGGHETIMSCQFQGWILGCFKLLLANIEAL
jgi:hypothetical protein